MNKRWKIIFPRNGVPVPFLLLGHDLLHLLYEQSDPTDRNLP